MKTTYFSSAPHLWNALSQSLSNPLKFVSEAVLFSLYIPTSTQFLLASSQRALLWVLHCVLSKCRNIEGVLTLFQDTVLVFSQPQLCCHFVCLRLLVRQNSPPWSSLSGPTPSSQVSHRSGKHITTITTTNNDYNYTSNLNSAI